MKGFKFLLVVTVLGCHFSLQAQQESALVKCLYESYKEQIDFYETLHRLEKQLLEEGVIEDTTAHDYQSMMKRINKDRSSFSLVDATADTYLSPEPFKACVADIKSNENMESTFRYMFLMAVYLDLSRRDHRISLLVDEQQQLWLNNKKTTMDEFEAELLKVKDALLKLGVPEEELELGLKVAPETKMGIIVDIQTILRDAGIRKIMYYGYE